MPAERAVDSQGDESERARPSSVEGIGKPVRHISAQSVRMLSVTHAAATCSLPSDGDGAGSVGKPADCRGAAGCVSLMRTLRRRGPSMQRAEPCPRTLLLADYALRARQVRSRTEEQQSRSGVSAMDRRKDEAAQSPCDAKWKAQRHESVNRRLTFSLGCLQLVLDVCVAITRCGTNASRFSSVVFAPELDPHQQAPRSPRDGYAMHLAPLRSLGRLFLCGHCCTGRRC